MFNTGTPSFTGLTGLYGGVKGSVGLIGGSTGAVVMQQLSGISTAGASVRLTADGSAAASTNVLNLPASTMAGLVLSVVARNTLNGDSAVWQEILVYGNQGGVITVSNPGTNAIPPDFVLSGGTTLSSMTGALMTVAADTPNLGVNITIAPQTGNTTAVLHCSGSFWGNQVS